MTALDIFATAAATLINLGCAISILGYWIGMWGDPQINLTLQLGAFMAAAGYGGFRLSRL